MVGELITLPLRVGVRATQLWLRVTEQTVSAAASLTGRLISGTSRGSDQPPARSFEAEQETGAAQRSGSAEDRRSDGKGRSQTADGRADKRARKPAPAPNPLLVADREPTHVSEEPQLVEEFAEPGVEEGAGAEIHVAEPWSGYDRMNAKQVIAKVVAATPAELAAVQLYESGHRRRQTILNAVNRELQNANGGGSHIQEGEITDA